MECSKCRVARGPNNFYAKGRVCKDCKRDYARKYRSSKASDMQSHATTDDASVRSVEDYLHMVDEDARDYLRTLEPQISAFKSSLIGEINSVKAEMLQAVSTLSEQLQKVEALLETLCSKSSNEKNVVSSHAHLVSYPLADLL